MTIRTSIKLGLITLGITLVALAFSIVGYVFTLEAVDVTSVYGYTEKTVSFCVTGIVFGALSYLSVVFSAIFIIKTVENCAKERKNGEKSRISIGLITLDFLLLSVVLTLAFSSTFGCVGLLC